MKKNQHGNCGPDDLCGYNKNELVEVYKRNYAGKIVTIYYNPNDINEFYVKEIEEEIMLQDFNKNIEIKELIHTAKIPFLILVVLFILLCIHQILLYL